MESVKSEYYCGFMVIKIAVYEDLLRFIVTLASCVVKNGVVNIKEGNVYQQTRGLKSKMMVTLLVGIFVGFSQASNLINQASKLDDISFTSDGGQFVLVLTPRQCRAMIAHDRPWFNETTRP